MTLTMSLGSFTSSARSVPWLGRLFARTGPAGQAAAASRSGWSPEGTAGQGRTVRSPAAAAATLVPVAAMALPGEGRARRWRVPGGWPLLVVLAVQAGLSLRLLRADTASQSEALYLQAGHLEWAHWLHGVPVPPFPEYFSGAPVLYPPIGAAADSIGGLAGARVLSLVFMLGATILLWGAAARLFGRRAAFFAAALFAVLGTTLHLGAFATYDAMSVFLVALAAWCVIRAGAREPATGWMVAAAAVLALANATAYTTLLFDPLIAALALLTAPWTGRGLLAARRAGTVLAATAALLAAGLGAGGSSYLGGFQRTMLTRVPGSASPLQVLGQSWSWAGLLLVLAVSGVVISWASRRGAAQTTLLAFLSAALVLGPVEQAHLHTEASLNHHVGLGAWFAAIAAGYAVDRFIEAAPAGRGRALTCGACVIALVFPAALGLTQSRAFSASWPNASAFIAIFGPLASHSTGPLLVEDPSVAEYYLPAGAHWQRWSSTRNITLPAGTYTGGPAAAASVTSTGNAPVYANYIAEGYFSLVALNFTDTTGLDRQIAADLRRNHHYHIIQVVPYGMEIPPIGIGDYVIWQYQATTRQAGYTPAK
jgi:4-amino-4-deoxy-L-arabinose transferase-like glycosyltransferase